MQIVLLTHERELQRPTNTGCLALTHFPEHCQQVVWSRVHPDGALLQACETGQALLMFPAKDEANNDAVQLAEAVMAIKPTWTSYSGLDQIEAVAQKQIIILDATWQEARKMMRQSPYLQQADRLALSGAGDSSYQLRRNQLEGGLCTIECVQLLFRQAGMLKQAEQLEVVFTQFNQRR
ncbi:tRNA-uridine aminocarboxypropyltransferase [Shewanella psychrotolerans]|uniref:tRNA-uridine aminocarboxypropyltransferase n=1 Tax=Shewanella psychrotolerans TaxID=2864206 RepID=UPI001C661497|nr:tRNA-uridine aminocarboxypropyltransferase [Shewanella psychrotolerans]QYJ99952.1 DTW domain-containing protein [Shewanella psychrotolerans]